MPLGIRHLKWQKNADVGISQTPSRDVEITLVQGALYLDLDSRSNFSYLCHTPKVVGSIKRSCPKDKWYRRVINAELIKLVHWWPLLEHWLDDKKVNPKTKLNKKVLLRERKRHTARCVANTPYVVLTGYPPGYPVRYPPGYPVRYPPGGVPGQVPPQGVRVSPLGGYPDPVRYPPRGVPGPSQVPPGGVPSQVPPLGGPGTPWGGTQTPPGGTRSGPPGGYPVRYPPGGYPVRYPPRGGTRSGPPRGGTRTPPGGCTRSGTPPGGTRSGTPPPPLWTDKHQWKQYLPVVLRTRAVTTSWYE